ncbi:MAG: helix-turn-helix domain-containing protein [Acutalibacteraceae bacterium]|nr:helix-turn-helix domain-containing protein [Acutalibacteraceae bacterium]
MVDIGKRLKDLRKEYGLTQQQVADRVWVSKSMISSYERSERTPSYEVLIKLAKLFGVSTDYLFGIETKRMISVEKLNDKQIKLVLELIDELGK